MGWTTPRDWTVGEVVTEDMMDTHVKNNLRYLKGLDGAVTLSDALILPDGAGYYLHIPSLTTTQRDALTPTAGMLIYNSTTTQFNKYENAAWRADLGFNSHHGDLSGLTDDDHTQYQKENLLTTAGDLPYATGASTWNRLGIGTANQLLRTNSGATAPEWASIAIGTSSGSYTGDNAQNRAIPHGLGATPKIVIIREVAGTSIWVIFGALAGITYIVSGGVTIQPVTIPDATNFYVGITGWEAAAANSAAGTYYWVAIG